MKKLQRQPVAQTLYYRLYVLYFEGSASALKYINKDAFYRISIWHEQDKIAEMLEGVSPVVLAKKIFLGSASITFSQTTAHPQVRARLWYFFKGDDYVVGQADLDLTSVNEQFLKNKQRYHDKKTINFGKNGQDLILTFNMFVDKGKVELDSFVRQFKEEEQKNNKRKRVDIGREKMSSVGEALKKTFASNPSSLQNSIHSPKILTMHSAQQPLAKIFNLASEQPLRKLEQIIRSGRVGSKASLVHIQVDEQMQEPVPIQEVESVEETKQYSGIEEHHPAQQPLRQTHQASSKIKRQLASSPKISNHANVQAFSSNPNDLEMNSAVRASNINKMRAVLQKIQAKREPSVSSQVTSFNKQFNDNKSFSMVVGTISVISDGSQASQMIVNNLHQTYSERAVANFKEKTVRCVNMTIVIFAIVLLYFLFVPSARFSKPAKTTRIRSRKMKESAEEALLQF